MTFSSLAEKKNNNNKLAVVERLFWQLETHALGDVAVVDVK